MSNAAPLAFGNLRLLGKCSMVKLQEFLPAVMALLPFHRSNFSTIINMSELITLITPQTEVRG